MVPVEVVCLDYFKFVVYRCLIKAYYKIHLATSWIGLLDHVNEFYTNISEKIIKILKMSSKILKKLRNYAAKMGQNLTQFLLPIKEKWHKYI